MNKIESVRKLNARELELGIAGTSASWHQQYARSPVIYVGGLQPNITPLKLVEVFEQYGVVNHVHLKRDEKTGDVCGFGFLAYADPRSAVLAVDNLNGFNLDGRLLSVDHVQDYKYPVDAYGASTELNMQPKKEPITENSGTPAMGSTSGGSGGANKEESGETLEKREDTVMARLKEFQRRRAEAEHAAKKNANGEAKISKKRPRSEVLSGGGGNERLGEGVNEHEKYEENKAVVPPRKRKEPPGAKEARRLERAAIREERRRRRARRLASRHDEEMK